MPNKVVTVKRWEVVAAFVLVVALAAGSVQWSNHNIETRVDAAEKRIRANAVTNEQQNEVRRTLLAELRATDERACLQTEALKSEFRQQAIRNYERLEQNARLLDIPVTRELRLEAALARDRTLSRFRAREC